MTRGMTSFAISSIERLVKAEFDPIHPGIDQFAERPGLLAQGQDFIDHLVDRAVDDQAIDHVIVGDLLIRLIARA